MPSAGGSPFILLDVDGVLHPLRPSGHPLLASMDDIVQRGEREAFVADDPHHTGEVIRGEFEPGCMNALHHLVQGCGAHIVLSSTWRETLPQRRAVDQQLQRFGMPCALGFTPQIPRYEGGGRGAEILAWVTEQEGISGSCCWIAIDDLELEQQLPPSHFLRTDPAVGLTTEDAERAAEMLRQQQRTALGLEASGPQRRGGMQRSTLGFGSALSFTKLGEPTGGTSTGG